MNTAETYKIMMLLSIEYPREVINRERTELWQDALQHADYHEMRAAVSKWISDPDQSQWFPKPGQLKAMCKATTRHARLEEDPACVDRYFELTARYQIEPLDGAETAELERIESALGVPITARCLVRFNRPVQDVAR